MSFIRIKPIFVNDDTGEESPFYDEVGTPEFYMITDTLTKYIGDKIYSYIDDQNTDYFIIKYNHKDTVKIIKNIYELNTLFPIYKEQKPSNHIKFKIINYKI